MIHHRPHKPRHSLPVSLVLLSGGLDSLVALAAARNEAKVVLALTFDYGQRARREELEAAQAIAHFYQIPHQKIALPWLAQLASTPLVSGKGKLPHLKSSELDHLQKTKASAKVVWVPNRNGAFINIAASFADELGIDQIVVGFNREEGATFPDNTRAYLSASTRSLFYSTQRQVKLVSPTIRWNKTQIVEHGLALGVPFHLFYSCYQAGKKMCGKCESCLRAKRAFKQAGAWDQIASYFQS